MFLLGWDCNAVESGVKTGFGFFLCFSGDSVIKKARPVLNVPLHFLLYIIVETFETMVAKNCTLFWLPQIPEVPLYLLCFCCALNVQCNPFGSALPKIHSFPLINHSTLFCFHAYVFFYHLSVFFIPAGIFFLICWHGQTYPKTGMG